MFVQVADAVHGKGYTIVIEWPRRCKYWFDQRVVLYLKKFEMFTSLFDGCVYGLVDDV